MPVSVIACSGPITGCGWLELQGQTLTLPTVVALLVLLSWGSQRPVPFCDAFLSVSLSAPIYSTVESGSSCSTFLYLLQCVFILRICVFPACISVTHMCVVPTEDRRGHWTLWNWNYRWLLGTMWMLGTKLGSSARATKALNLLWAISPASTFLSLSVSLSLCVCVSVCIGQRDNFSCHSLGILSTCQVW